MNMLFHYLRKDLRFLFRWPILLLLLEAIGGILWYASLPPEGRAGHITVLPFWHYSIWILCFLMSGALVQRDAPFQESAFFRTRPMALSTVLLAKAMATCALLLPFALIHSLSLLLLGLQPGVRDLFLIFAEEMLMLATLSAVSMAIAIRQESLKKYFSSVVGLAGVLLIGLMGFALCKDAFFRHNKPEWSYDLEYLKSSRMLITWLTALVVSVIGIFLFSRSRRMETITITLAVTALCAITTLWLWPLNFVKTCAPTAREAPKSEWQDPAKLTFAFEEPQSGRDGKSMFSFNDGGYNSERYRKISASGKITGLANGWVAQSHNSYQSVLTLSNGTRFSKSGKAWAGLGWEFILPQLGIQNHYMNDENQPRNFELGEFNLQDASSALTGAKLKGTMQIPIKRAVILARLPLRKGVTTVIDGRRITITNVLHLGTQIRVNFVTQTHMIHLQGGWQKIWTNRFQYGVIHAARREFLVHAGGGGSNLRSGHLSVQDESISGRLLANHHEKPIPEDWLNGAEFIITSDENGGSFSQSFDFPNINLSNER